MKFFCGWWTIYTMLLKNVPSLVFDILYKLLWALVLLKIKYCICAKEKIYTYITVDLNFFLILQRNLLCDWLYNVLLDTHSIWLMAHSQIFISNLLLTIQKDLLFSQIWSPFLTLLIKEIITQYTWHGLLRS